MLQPVAEQYSGESPEKEQFSPASWEAEMQKKHLGRIKEAVQLRNSPFHKFDGLSLLQCYYANEDARNSYLRPKRNDDEVRVVSAATEKRIESLYNEIISMNIRHEIHTYDKD